MRHVIVFVCVGALIVWLAWVSLSVPVPRDMNRQAANPATAISRLGGAIGGPTEAVANEDVLLPITEPTLGDVHGAFAPLYGEKTDALISPSLRPLLEAAVFHNLSFEMRGDEESLRWRREAFCQFWSNRPLSANYKISPDELRREREQVVGGPIRRMGFADRAFKIEKTKCEQFLGPGVNLAEEFKAKLQRDLIVVTVYTVHKLTPTPTDPGLYRPNETVFLYDPEASSPAFCRLQGVNHHFLATPAVDIPRVLKTWDLDGPK